MRKPVSRLLLEGVTLVCIPALLAGLAFGDCVPAHPNPATKLGVVFGRMNAEPVAATLILFLFFSALTRRGLRFLEQRGVLPSFPQRVGERAGRRVLRFALTLALAAMLALLVRASVGQPYRVLSASMLPTLEPGAWIFANKLSYGLWLPGTRIKLFSRLPNRGDVIALETPPDVTDAAPQLVKRVLGLPGDHITMRGGRPLINGWAVPACDAGMYTYTVDGSTEHGRLLVEYLGASSYLTVYIPERSRFSGYTVGPGEVFVLGDNRNNSSDSRAWAGGQGRGLPLSEIDGRISHVLFSFDAGGNLDRKSLLRSLTGALQLPETQAATLAAGIAHCQRNPPRATLPPAPH